MKNITTLTLGALSLVALASACNVEVADGPMEDIDTSQEAVACGNEEGVASVMAAIAVSSGMEMRRWLADPDMQWNTTKGQLELSQYAWPRCPNSNCKNTAVLLQLQNDSAAGTIVGGQELKPSILRDRMKTYWDRQKLCHTQGNCPAPRYRSTQPIEYHDLTFLYKTPSTCGSDFHFHGCKQGTNCTELSMPASLANGLIFAGYPENQYLNFYNNGGFVRIDPTGGLDPGDNNVIPGSSPVCYADCTTTNAGLAGACCQCKKVVGSITTTINGTFKTGAIAGMWQCKL
jgi:hypothetical protein